MGTMMALMKPKLAEPSSKLAPWIETFSGVQFYFLDPKEDQINIRDIAHSLAFTCRYTGQSNRFYSVAEHSIFVSYLASDPLAGLLHDASEAYITDIASPIKPHLSNYKELEDMLMGRIAAKFGFTYPLDPDIKDCDATQLKTEAKYLLKSRGNPWAHLYPTRRAHGIKPQCMAPEEAEQAFLERFNEVKNESISTDWSDWPYNKADNRSFCLSSGSELLGMEELRAYERSLRSKDSSRQGNNCAEDAGCCSTGPEGPNCRPSESKETVE